MLVELLTGHINQHYTLHKMRRAKNLSCSRHGAKKEMSEHILCECLVLEKINVQLQLEEKKKKMQNLGFARMDPDQIKEARLSCIVALCKEAGNSFL